MTNPNSPPNAAGPAVGPLRSSAGLLFGSALIALAGTLVLGFGGRWFGALAFGGVNALSLVLWVLVRDRAERLTRRQSNAEAAAMWIASPLFAAGIVLLYWWDYRPTATWILAGVTGLFLVGVWLVECGAVDEPEDADGAAKG